jgi:SARP family transcriptional regulator, regulator of embCAB operon
VSVHFGLLGPLQLTTDQHKPVELGPPQRRSVLALLLLAVGKTVPVAMLRERIWAASPPVSAAAAIQVHVHHLRRILTPLTSGLNGDGRPRLVTHPGFPSLQVSYELDAAPDSVDLTSFRKLLDKGELALNQGEIPRALTQFDAGLSLWRGYPLPEMQPSAYVLNIRRSMTDLRRDAAKQRATCLLQLGSLASAADALQELHVEYPDDERIVVLLARALHRMGADARALRLVTDELDRRQQAREVLPRTLLQQRDLMMMGVTPAMRDERDTL